MRALAAAALALAAALSPADDEPLALSELELDLSALRASREQVFEYRIGSQSFGTITLSTEGTDDGAIRLRDVYDMDFDGQRFAVDLEMICDATPTLPPRTIRCEAEGDSDEAKTYSAERDGDDLVVHMNGRDPRTHAFGADTTSYEALFRIVTLLPFEEGLRVAVPNRFEGIEANMHSGRGEVIAYAGTEWYAADGRTLETLHRFDRAGSFGSGTSYWVNGDRELRRVVIDGRKGMRPVRPEGDK